MDRLRTTESRGKVSEPNLQMSRGMTNAIAIAAIAFAKETKIPR